MNNNESNNIDYNKLLDEWYDRVVKEADKMKKIMNEEEYDENGYLVMPPTQKYIRALEFRNGLYYATAILSRLDSIEEKKNKKVKI